MRRKLNTYQSVTLYIYKKEAAQSGYALVYTSVHDANLKLLLTVDEDQGKKELARLMLRTMKMPVVHRYPWHTSYELTHFFD